MLLLDGTCTAKGGFLRYTLRALLVVRLRCISTSLRDHRLLLRLCRALFASCDRLGRAEDDDGASPNEVIIDIDGYGDECGEWPFDCGVRTDAKHRERAHTGCNVLDLAVRPTQQVPSRVILFRHFSQ